MVKARISNLHRREADWNKLKSFIPKAGEFIIYDPDEHINYTRVKVGDGIRTLQELEFFSDIAAQAVLREVCSDGVIDGGRITGLPD